MNPTDLKKRLEDFREALSHCQQLFRECALLVVDRHARELDRPADQYLQFMDDLHKGFLVKLYVGIMEADLRWSEEEQAFAKLLFEHTWGKPLADDELKEAATTVMHDASGIRWPSLVKPLMKYSAMRERRAEVLAIIMRVANMVAKCDGTISPGESAQLVMLQNELEELAELAPNATLPETSATMTAPLDSLELPAPISTLRDREGWQRLQSDGDSSQEKPSVSHGKTANVSPPSLDEALAQLSALVGLDQVKSEVQTLANFLKMQRARCEQGLPATPLSLHMVFSGNAGTGKTTVARIIGKILGAMGVLKRGHLVETDRSGLVAEFAGQTGPKTNKCINDALDGVLFIDEAYSLSYEEDQDPYGAEALQTLLKRMEDDRERLVVVLAGYPEPMSRLLKSNPGLSSRFNTHLHFEDYRPGEMGRIFQSLCDKHQYVVPGEVQARLLNAFRYLYDRRDDHFGNGRLVRNVFETAIRRLANRIVGDAPLTKEMLTTLASVDLLVPNLSAELLEEAIRSNRLYEFHCRVCNAAQRGGQNVLARTVKCQACGEKFVANWGDPCE